MTEVRRIDLSARGRRPARTSARSARGEPASRRAVATPLCFEERVFELMPALEADPDALKDVTCRLCYEKDVTCSVILNCGDSGAWCWVCQLKLARQLPQTSPTDVTSCPCCKVNIKPAYLSRKMLDWDKVDREVPFVAEAFAYCRDEEILNAVTAACEWLCWFPECNLLNCGSEREWRTHLSKVHNRKVCDVCFQNKKKVFLPCQHTLYDPNDLARHKRIGDPIPHVKCPACGLWLFDDEAFFNHWSRSNDHLDCQFCMSEGDSRAIFPSFEELQKHHQISHFVCPDCAHQAEQSGGGSAEALTVFGDYHSLVKHRALQHPSGKRGVVDMTDYATAVNESVNLSKAKDSSTDMRRELYNSKESSVRKDFWPDAMIAVSGQILREIKNKANATASPPPQHYDKAYQIALRKLCGDQRAELFRREFEAFLKGRQVGAAALLGQLAHLVWSGYWETYKKLNGGRRQLTDHDAMSQNLQSAHLPGAKSAEIDQQIREHVWDTGAAYWVTLFEKEQAQQQSRPSQQNSLAIPSQVIVFFVLHIPPTGEYRAKRQELIAAMETIAHEANDAKSRLRGINSSGVSQFDADEEDNNGEAEEDSVLRDSITGYYSRPILAECTSLPINNHLPFVRAAYWALCEFLMRCGNDSVESMKPLPPAVIHDMSTQRTRSELELCSKISQDLSDESVLTDQSALDLFLSLRPRYANISRTPLIVGPRRAGHEMNEPTRNLVMWRLMACLSKRWGTHADQVFKRIKKQNLWLIKEYTKVSIELLPQAVGVLPQLTGGVPTHKAADSRRQTTVEELRRERERTSVPGSSPTPPAPRTAPLPAREAVPSYVGYNTWTQQTFKPTPRQLSEDQYPPLGATAPAPPGLEGREPAPKPRQWTRHSYYVPPKQVCGTCRAQFDPDANRCPSCHTWMHLTSRQRAENLMRGEEYPQLTTTAPSARRWAPALSGPEQLMRTYTGRSGPPKHF